MNLCSGEEFRLSDCDHSIVDYYDGCSDNAGVTCGLGKIILYSLHAWILRMQAIDHDLQLTVLMARRDCQRGRQSGRGDWRSASVGDGVQ